MLLGILGGGARPVLQNPKNVIFHARFPTWPLGRNYVIITWTRIQTKNSSNPFRSFRIRIFLFLCYSFGIEAIHNRSSLENHTRLKTKMGKICIRLGPKRRKTPLQWGGS